MNLKKNFTSIVYKNVVKYFVYVSLFFLHLGKPKKTYNILTLNNYSLLFLSLRKKEKKLLQHVRREIQISVLLMRIFS